MIIYTEACVARGNRGGLCRPGTHRGVKPARLGAPSRGGRLCPPTHRAAWQVLYVFYCFQCVCWVSDGWCWQRVRGLIILVNLTNTPTPYFSALSPTLRVFTSFPLRFYSRSKFHALTTKGDE